MHHFLRLNRKTESFNENHIDEIKWQSIKKKNGNHCIILNVANLVKSSRALFIFGVFIETSSCMIGATCILADYVINAFGLVRKPFMSKCLVYVHN